jgi:hypothetical protein
LPILRTLAMARDAMAADFVVVGGSRDVWSECQAQRQREDQQFAQCSHVRAPSVTENIGARKFSEHFRFEPN